MSNLTFKLGSILTQDVRDAMMRKTDAVVIKKRHGKPCGPACIKAEEHVCYPCECDDCN